MIRNRSRRSSALRKVAAGCAAAVGVVAIAGCNTTPVAQAGPAPATEAAGRYGDLMMNVTSFGRLTSHWRIGPDGVGELWRDQTSGPPGIVAKYRGRLAPEHRAAFIRELERHRSGAVPPPACPQPVHDAPSLEFRWGAGQADHLGFYYGCLDPASRAYGQRISALNAIVTDHFQADPAPYAVESVASVPRF
jgi:hypothetical protein